MRGYRGKSYLSEFTRNADGEYVYTGAYYTPDGDAKKTDVRLSVLFAVSLLAVLGSGCVNAAGLSNTFYVILPYIGEVAAMFSLGWNTVRLVKQSEKVRAYVYSAVRGRLPTSALAMSVFALLGLAGSAVFLILNGAEDRPLLCAVYLAAKLLVAALGFTDRRYFKGLVWKKTD